MAARSEQPRSSSNATDCGPLSAIRVIEYGQGVSAASATKYLADLGAEVIKVEPPGGDVMRQRGPYFDDIADREHGGMFLYLNTNKKGAVLDLAHDADRSIFSSL